MISRAMALQAHVFSMMKLLEHALGRQIRLRSVQNKTKFVQLANTEADRRTNSLRR